MRRGGVSSPDPPYRSYSPEDLKKRYYEPRLREDREGGILFATTKTLTRFASKKREERGDAMSEERPHHPQDPAEGAEEAEGAPGAERAGKDDGGRQEEDQERPVEHPQEPAEGAEEALGAKRAEGAR